TPTMTMNQLAAPALPASLTAKVMEQTLITSRTAPSQSTLMPLDGLDSGAQAATIATAMKPTMAMSQKTERKPQCSAIQPETNTSTPATPPLIAATRPSKVPRRTSFFTCQRKIISVIGMVVPEMPCKARANTST